MRALMGAVAVLFASACSEPIDPLATAEHGVVFTFPIDGQVDVPLGARIVVAFSEPVVASAVDAITLQGPAGPLAATAEVSADGMAVAFVDAPLEAGTTYDVIVRPELAPGARNLPPSGPLLSFTTRTARPRAAIPSLVAVNGGPPAMPTAFRPMFETSTIRLVFSEPLDPRTVVIGPGAVELVDTGTQQPVPVTLLAHGIHVSLDPVDDLAAGATYELRLGNRIVDLGGQALPSHTIRLSPVNSRGTAPIPQVLRTRQITDPGPEHPRSGGDRNVITIDKPIIGRETSTLLPAALAAELGDPKALGGPIAFTIRRGQRMRATGLDVKLGGEIPVGLSTGEILIELVSDGGGRIYRNPYQPGDQRPENARSPLFVDLSLDVAVYAVDPHGNAVLSQTVLGVQATGTASATEGVLAIESVASMELGLLGVTTAPTNLVLELITDPDATADRDITPPAIISTSPADGTAEHAVDTGIEILFDEPIDLDAARAGELRLESAAGTVIPSVFESRGAAIVIRPVAPLAYSTAYRVVYGSLRDVAGNPMPFAAPLTFSTPRFVGTGVPMTATAIHPGVACALANGRCAGGQGGDDTFQPFTLPANQPVEVTFSQPLNASTVVLGSACGTGTVRVEELSAGGTCTAAVRGTLIRRDRSLTFVPDVPWVDGTRYRVTLVSGGDEDCDGGELCGASGDAASFDPLRGVGDGDGGGPNLVVDFTGAPPSKGTLLLAGTGPMTDVNGNGSVDGGEVRRDENRAAMRITGTGGAIGGASFEGDDCVPSTPQREACMYLSGAMPVIMGEVTSTCPLPGGMSAASCLPVTLSAQPMFGTSVSMSASIGFSIDTDTGTSIMRVREPAGGPVTGFIIDEGGTPTLIVELGLYMDAPDMSVPLSDHDLHSKPLNAILRGPMTFLPDGRISIALANTADLPVTVNIDAPLGVNGRVNMVVPANEMKLSLVSPSARGVLR